MSINLHSYQKQFVTEATSRKVILDHKLFQGKFFYLFAFEITAYMNYCKVALNAGSGHVTFKLLFYITLYFY